MTTRVILAALVLALVAACGAAEREYPERADADPEAVENVRATLRLADPAAENVPADLAWRLAVDTCRRLDGGADPPELVTEMAEGGFTAELAAAVLVAASLDVCPHHADTVAEWSGS